MAALSDPWPRLRQEHLDAVERFAALARCVPPDRWPLPAAPGKWSPAQITEHVVLTYETLAKELSGGGGMRLRTKWWQRILLKGFLLPRILRTGEIPTAVAVRELRPGSSDLDQAALIDRLRGGALGLDGELYAGRTSAQLTHPYFGRLKAADVLRFCAIHATHHARQLPQAPAAV